MARVVGSESIATGDFILVNHSIREYPTVDRSGSSPIHPDDITAQASGSQ